MSLRRSWRPLLAGPAAERALRIAEEIAADLRAGLAAPPRGAAGFRQGPSLAGGDAGLAVFFSYLDQARPGQGYDDTAMELLERAIEATGEMQTAPSLYGGFAGVGAGVGLGVGGGGVGVGFPFPGGSDGLASTPRLGPGRGVSTAWTSGVQATGSPMSATMPATSTAQRGPVVRRVTVGLIPIPFRDPRSIGR